MNHTIHILLDFLAEKLKNGKWVVLYHANWCPHCVNFLPVFDKLAKMNHNNANFAKYMPIIMTSLLVIHLMYQHIQQ